MVKLGIIYMQVSYQKEVAFHLSPNIYSRTDFDRQFDAENHEN
jgi:hypothetical protein